MNNITLKDVNVKKFMKLLQNTMTFKKNMLTLYIDGDVLKSFSKNDTGTMFKYMETNLSEYCASIESEISERGTVIFTSSEKIINVMKNLGTEECDITIEFIRSNVFGMLSRVMKISNKFFEVNLPAMSEDLCDVIKPDIYFKDSYSDRFIDVPTSMEFNIPDIKQIMSCMNISDENDKVVIYDDVDKNIYLSQLVDKEVAADIKEIINADKVFKYNIESVSINEDMSVFYMKEHILQVNPNNEYKASIIKIAGNDRLVPLRLLSEGACKELYVITNIVA